MFSLNKAGWKLDDRLVRTYVHVQCATVIRYLKVEIVMKMPYTQLVNEVNNSYCLISIDLILNQIRVSHEW